MVRIDELALVLFQKGVIGDCTTGLGECDADMVAVNSIDQIKTPYAQKGGHDLGLAAR